MWFWLCLRRELSHKLKWARSLTQKPLLTLGELVDLLEANTVSAQQWPLNSLGNHTALDCILAEQGSGLCKSKHLLDVDTCLWGSKDQLHKIKKVPWLQQISPGNPLLLLSWLPSDLFRTILQTRFGMFLILLLYSILTVLHLLFIELFVKLRGLIKLC